MDRLPVLSEGFSALSAEFNDALKMLLEENRVLKRRLDDMERERDHEGNSRALRRRISELRDDRLGRAPPADLPDLVDDADSDDGDRDSDLDADGDRDSDLDSDDGDRDSDLDDADDLPDGFAEAWNQLRDLEVTFRGQTRTVANWCPFSTDLADPRCVLKVLDPPADGSTGYTLFPIDFCSRSSAFVLNMP
jgi:hypothetical protein